VIYQVSQVKEMMGFLPDRVNTERNMKERFTWLCIATARKKKPAGKPVGLRHGA
jgi:hypothetical protein